MKANAAHDFAGGPDGANPLAGLIDVNGVLYGTTMAGGGGNTCFIYSGTCGTVYTVTAGGVETVLYRFVGGTHGFDPGAPLTNVNGTLYGTTYLGGVDDRCCHIYGHGTVFSLSP
ncbi:MAG TPA: choice-of-anchor tandem repeat GloVer-containing protein [Candidatus Cybelea sp.]